MNTNIEDDEYQPQEVHDRIIQDLIDQLLDPSDDFENPERKFDKYSLAPTTKFWEDPRFIHGQKKPMQPIKLKSASIKPKELPRADKELKPAYLVTEVKMMRLREDDIDLLGIYATKDKFTKITINGLPGLYHIATNKLKELVYEYLTESIVTADKIGDIFSVRARIDCQALGPYLYRIHKK